jgi:hypothetical protein
MHFPISGRAAAVTQAIVYRTQMLTASRDDQVNQWVTWTVASSLWSSWPIKNCQTSVTFRQYAEVSNMFFPCKDYNIV